MNRQPASQHLTINFRPMPPNDGIEWEDMPSRAVQRAEARQDVDEDWTNTMPASLMEVASPPRPFREPLDGLSMREMDEPEIFQHFFGK